MLILWYLFGNRCSFYFVFFFILQCNIKDLIITGAHIARINSAKINAVCRSVEAVRSNIHYLNYTITDALHMPSAPSCLLFSPFSQSQLSERLLCGVQRPRCPITLLPNLWPLLPAALWLLAVVLRTALTCLWFCPWLLHSPTAKHHFSVDSPNHLIIFAQV